MKFEYDPVKSLRNTNKHGVTFEQAKTLWDGDAVIVPARTRGELRFMIIGRIGERLYSCVYTVRHFKIRLISCRQSSTEERSYYHEKVNS